ncbi:hypothetical protein ACHAWU_004891 [Discostella pseudostelligera]|uniref:Uncharacterized protein n=1 Tax=Discostella pseudostelligera TaxID=259834 RepID=A0ABD3M2Q5_9STRA
MGQATSKAATEAVKAAVKRRAPPSNNNIAQTIQHQDRVGGFYPGSGTTGSSSSSNSTRAQQHQADTARRIANAASSRSDDTHASSSDSTLLELPPDLIKFLNDAGPVTRTIDKQLTSARVYDALVQDEKVVREHAKQANTRVRRRMPILSSSGDATCRENLEEDGTMTERTTNFSTTKRSSNTASAFANNYLGVTRQDFFDLSIKVSSVTVDSPEWKKVVHDQYEEIAKRNDASSSSQQSKSKKATTDSKGGFDRLRDIALLENSARYIGVPVLMKDTDGDIIGMWQHKVEDMKHSFGLKAIRKNSLQFVMQNEGGGNAKGS